MYVRVSRHTETARAHTRERERERERERDRERETERQRERVCNSVRSGYPRRDDREAEPASAKEELPSLVQSVPAQGGDSDRQRCTERQRTGRRRDLRAGVAQVGEIERADVSEVEQRVQYLCGQAHHASAIGTADFAVFSSGLHVRTPAIANARSIRGVVAVT